MSNDIERELFEQRFPVPAGIYWNDVSEQYDALPGAAGLDDVEIYHGQWMGWQAARAQSGHGAEPVGWQFYQDGNWWHGDDRIKDHRKNTEEAGFRIRDVYATPQPEGDGWIECSERLPTEADADANGEQVATLRQQLADAKEENEQVRQANLDVMMHFEDMKAAKEKAEARVAELSNLCGRLQHCAQGFYVDQGDYGYMEAIMKDYHWIMRASKPWRDAYIKRVQAEAVEQAKYEHALTARIPDGTAGEHFQDGFDTAAEQYDASLDRYAQRLRKQADEAERAGGEK